MKFRWEDNNGMDFIETSFKDVNYIHLCQKVV